VIREFTCGFDFAPRMYASENNNSVRAKRMSLVRNNNRCSTPTIYNNTIKPPNAVTYTRRQYQSEISFQTVVYIIHVSSGTYYIVMHVSTWVRHTYHIYSYDATFAVGIRTSIHVKNRAQSRKIRRGTCILQDE